jgi:methylenetetrahydrofolate reductase (NADPH)
MCVQVNGSPSSDTANGWGPEGGHVYQKGFVELFCSPEAFKQLETTLKDFKTLRYSASNAAGEVSGSIKTTAVSWGVFPGTEIKQALVASADSFKVWAQEAFALWSMWADLLQAGSPGKAVLEDIQKSWYLVAVVEENYASGDVFSFL